VPSREWIEALRRRCSETGAFLIFDEVQCGLGRTGHLWGHEPFDVEPDLLTLAKPLAGGLPMGAVLLGGRVAKAVKPGVHATTFGGGPLVARVALRVFRTIADPDFLAEVRRKGKMLRDRLEAIESPRVREVRGLGLFLGVQVEDPAAVRDAALAERLLLVPAGDDVLRFLPPLNAPDSDLDEAATRFERALGNTPRKEER
jgi:acetylornithine/succinyldiaminopimelate/putrescine aminotransferase